MPITEEMPAWPGTPMPAQQWLERLKDGDECDVSAWTIGAHAGTHLDAPSHFIPGGADVERLGLAPLVGPCVVLRAADLASLQLPCERVLLKAAERGLTPEQAHWLVCGGVRLVGTDALSIETAESVAAGAAVHRVLLGAGVAILEGLQLHDIEPGEYYLVAVPPRFQHAEASPVRAILLDFQGIFRR